MNAKPRTKKNGPGGFSLRLSPEDAKLFIPILMLVGVGLIMVFSASFTIALSTKGSGYFYLKRHAAYAAAGLAGMFVFRFIPYQWYRHLVYMILFGSFGLLCLVFIPGLGHTVGGSTRWIDLGVFTFQPSELARVAMMIYLAYSLSKKQEQIERFSVGALPHFAVLGIFALMLFRQPDFGSMMIMVAMTWIVLFYSGVRLLHLMWPLPALVPALYYLMVMAPYRWDRLTSFLDPWAYEANKGYQLVHSQMAFGTGGVWGVGVGKGFQKLFYLPEPHTDFVFSVVGEELGLVYGVLPILLLFAWIIWRGILISRRAPDRFGSILAMGITVGLALQACINFCVTLGLMPTKGLPLPFLSYGGTSLIVTMITMGILMNIGSARRV